MFDSSGWKSRLMRKIETGIEKTELVERVLKRISPTHQNERRNLREHLDSLDNTQLDGILLTLKKIKYKVDDILPDQRID